MTYFLPVRSSMNEMNNTSLLIAESGKKTGWITRHEMKTTFHFWASDSEVKVNNFGLRNYAFRLVCFL